MAEYFLIAKIQSAYGKEGFVRIFSYSDFPERFYDLHKVYIDFFGDKKEFYIEKVEKRKDSFIIKFKNFSEENDLEVLIGKEIFVDEKGLVKLPSQQYFIHDIIDSLVFQNNTLIGKIKDVLSFPANDVYIIDSNGKEILIPAIKEFIEKFEISEKKLILKKDVDISGNED